MPEGKIVEHQVVIDKLAGIRQTYTVDDVKERIIASLDQLLMSWIAKEGRDTKRGVETELKTFQRRQERNDIGFDIIASFILKNTFHNAVIQENGILPRTNDQPGTLQI